MDYPRLSYTIYTRRRSTAYIFDKRRHLSTNDVGGEPRAFVITRRYMHSVLARMLDLLLVFFPPLSQPGHKRKNIWVTGFESAINHNGPSRPTYDNPNPSVYFRRGSPTPYKHPCKIFSTYTSNTGRIAFS